MSVYLHLYINKKKRNIFARTKVINQGGVILYTISMFINTKKE